MLGSAADELFLGYLGDDIIEGDAGFDTMLFIDDEAPDGVGVDLLAGIAWGAGDDSLGGIDGVLGTGSDDFLAGGPGTQLLIGGAGNDSVYGDADVDVVLGGDGDDYVTGDDGDDVVDGGPGDDWIEGGSGADLLEFASSPAVYVDIHPAEAYADDDDDGIIDDAVYDVESVAGTPGNDVILGTDGPDELLGGFGDDYLGGRGGDDTLTLYGTGTAVGGDGTDRCSAGTSFECEVQSAPPASAAATGVSESAQILSTTCAQCILGGTSTLGGTSPLDWWLTYPFGDTYCIGNLIGLNLPANPARDFNAQPNKIELWVQLNRWTGTQWVYDSTSAYMWWDPSLRLFNVNWPLGSFLNPQTDIGGWRYFNGQLAGRAFAISINPGYAVQFSVVVRWVDWYGITRVLHSWPSAGTSYCSF